MEARVNAVGPMATDQAGGSGPLPAELVLGATPVLKEPRLVEGRLFWLEQLPQQRGRTTLRIRTTQGAERELTPELDLRSRIHGYGGGVYCVASGACTGTITGSGSPLAGNTCVAGTDAGGSAASGSGSGGSEADRRPAGEFRAGELSQEEQHPGTAPVNGRPAGQTVVVVAEGGRSLWRLDLPCDHPGEPEPAVTAAPVRITPAAEQLEGPEQPALFADGLIDLSRQRWIGVCEQDDRDRLVAVPLDGGGSPRVLWESPDFCGYAALSPCGSQLAWVSWRQPCMPWDRSQLWLGRFDASGSLMDVRPIAGSAPGDDKAVSVFQPLWAGPDLVVANDRSGWWNLELLEDAEALTPDALPAWRPLLPMQAEFAMPQWVYGMRTTAWDGERLMAACCRDGRWELGALVPVGDAGAAAPIGTGNTAEMPSLPAETSDLRAASADQSSAALDAAERHGTTCTPGATPHRGAGSDSSRGTDRSVDPAMGWTVERTAGPTDATGPVAASPPADASDRNGATSAGIPVSLSAAARPAPTLRGPLRWQPIPLPFDDLSALDAEAGTLVAIASGPLNGPGLLELDLPDPAGRLARSGARSAAPSAPDRQQRAESLAQGAGGAWTHRPAAAAVLPPEQISHPEPLWFSGHGGLPTHAWYYPPRDGASPASPLLVRGHSGPTAMARTGLSLAIQFWTSRGWGVLDVNYGGSTGFGRAYRERLDGLWGVVDVDDCLAAARSVVETGRADPGRIAMEGSSASGFTVLAAMARGTTLRAGAIRYPVTDLTALAECDHRFEARYFDALVGPWPAARAIYEQRSPLQQVERINAPLLFFHGIDDTVVPAQQSVAMVERLRQRDVPVELQLFEGEGHGFRDGAVQREVLERSEAFFRRLFSLPEPT